MARIKPYREPKPSKGKRKHEACEPAAHSPLPAKDAQRELAADDDLWEDEEHLLAEAPGADAGPFEQPEEGLPSVTCGATGQLEVHVPLRAGSHDDDADDGADEARPAKKVRRPSRHERDVALLVHRAHLLALVARASACSTVCDDEMVQTRLLSLLPSHLKPRLAWPAAGSPAEAILGGRAALHSAQSLEPIVKWVSKLVAEDARASLVWPSATPARSTAGGAAAAGGGAGSSSAAMLAPAASSRAEDRSALAHALDTRRAPAAVKQQLCVALLRALGLATRWVQPLCAVTPLPAAKLAQAVALASSAAERSQVLEGAAARDLVTLPLCWAEVAVRSDPAADVTHVRDVHVTDDVTDVAMRAANARTVRWAHADCAIQAVDSPRVYNHVASTSPAPPSAGRNLGRPRRTERPPAGQWGYVCALTAAYATDVTPRYVPSWPAALEHRGPDERWWQLALDRSSADGAQRAAACDGEARELAQLRLAAPLPTTMSGFRKDPRYVLERDIGSARAVRPGARPLCALLRGTERAFQASDLSDLRSAAAWFKKGRQLLASEVGKPVRSSKGSAGEGEQDAQAEAETEWTWQGPVPALPLPASSPVPCPSPALPSSNSPAQQPQPSAAPLPQPSGLELTHPAWFRSGGLGGRGARLGGLDAAAASASRELYADWQTEELVVPLAHSGRVPRNAYGCVDAFSAAHLPTGTLHLRLPRIAQLARTLQIDYAPAKVGFDWAAGAKATPRFDGIVVCVEHEQMLREAHAEMMERQLELEEKRMEREAVADWRLLFRTLSTALRLSKTYDGTARGSETAAQGAEVLD